VEGRLKQLHLNHQPNHNGSSHPRKVMRNHNGNSHLRNSSGNSHPRNSSGNSKVQEMVFQLRWLLEVNVWADYC
jgi:hypothetical protein